jgi:peptidyl-prolyl cis-trans isomerase C
MVNRALLAKFLDAQSVAVGEPEIDAELDKIRKDLKERQQGDLASFLTQMQVSPETFREQLRLGLRWTKYLASQGSDQALRDYFQKKYDLFAGTQVKASHILIKVPTDASEDARQAARQKLLDIKKEIADGKIAFAEAANKYSEDDSNRTTPDGGNLDYFALRGNLIDSFCDAAFALKPNEVSDPVETELGYHLILVTDRAKGQEVKYEDIKANVEQIFGSELQSKVVEDTRKASKITLQPMPADFFPKAPATTPAPASSVPSSVKGDGASPPGQGN